MKKYIVFALLVMFFFSFLTSTVRCHTWFFLRKCMNTSSFETLERIELLKLLATRLDVKDEESTVLTNEDMLHQNKLVTGLTSLISPKSSIFCTTMPIINTALIDIYTDDDIFNRGEVGEICRKYFDAESHNLSYTVK